MLAPGRPIEPLPEAEASALLASSAAGQPRRVPEPQRLLSSALACPVLHEGWIWLLTPGAACLHTLLCSPPVTATGVRGGQSVQQLIERIAGRGLIVGLPLRDDVAAEIAAEGSPAQQEALAQLRLIEHADLDPVHVERTLHLLAELGLVVEHGGRWWCAASRVAPPAGGRRELQQPPLSRPWRHAASLAAEALFMCWVRRTDRYSLPAWDLLDPEGPDAHRRDLLFSGGPQAGEQFAAIIEAASATGLRMNSLSTPLVTLVPSELQVELGDDLQPSSPDVPAMVDLSLTFRVQFARALAAGLLAEAERHTLAASGVATCDAATPARDMVQAVLSLMPQAWRPLVEQHAQRLEERGTLGDALASRSLAELAADAGPPVHRDRRAAAALALRSEPVGYTSAGSVLHECNDPTEHVTPFGIAEQAADDSPGAKSWRALYEHVVGSTETMTAAGSNARGPASTTRSPLGVPLSAPAEAEDTGSPVPAGRSLPLALLRFTRTWTALEYDRAVLDAGGRWPDRLAPMPSVLPGDAVALRAAGVEQQISRWDCWSEEMNASTAFAAREPMADQAFDMHLSAALLAQAVPFFLPQSVAAGVAGSLPPTDDVLAALQLPHPVCLLALGAPMLLQPRSEHWPKHLLPDLAAWNDAVRDEDASLGQLREHDRPQADQAVRTRAAAGAENSDVARSPVLRRGRTASCADVISVTRMPLLAALWRFGALIDGVVLLAADGGGVRDECLWLVRVPDPADATRSIGRAVVHGQVRDCAFRDQVANLATALAVSDWHVPGSGGEAEVPADPRSPAFRKAVRKPSFPEHEATGAAGGVRVLTLPTPPDEDEEQPEPEQDAPRDGSGRPLRTHLRRGHWKRVRVGPRTDWQYRSVLILPTVVNAAAQNWRGVVVYRVPEPRED